MEPVSENYGQTVEDKLTWVRVHGTSWRECTERALITRGELYRSTVCTNDSVAVAMVFVPVMR